MEKPRIKVVDVLGSEYTGNEPHVLVEILNNMGISLTPEQLQQIKDWLLTQDIPMVEIDTLDSVLSRGNQTARNIIQISADGSTLYANVNSTTGERVEVSTKQMIVGNTNSNAIFALGYISWEGHFFRFGDFFNQDDIARKKNIDPINASVVILQNQIDILNGLVTNLQTQINAQSLLITELQNTKLSLTGGTMTGGIDV